ncbi:unnamed protein product [Rotaria sordida]|uniref:PNT domain-containing protein n=1 Tax=Rotaria sordida TaxID=392033 RepID=A0A813PCB8_9BILA|nr:unnamed protein product [Rotaria sordida]CAF0788597.1 unnamed protein product [Rotaria sordida]
MTNATTTTSTTNATAMGNGNKKAHANSLSADDLHKYSTKPTTRDVSKWSSLEVQHWIRHQCKKFELNKAITEQFELNGQALMLLSKHDFIRRAPNGGEVLYYALQRLINPNKETNSAGNNASTLRAELSDQQSRIVEVNNDQDTVYDTADSSSTRPIVEEPDDPPLLRKSQSATNHDADQHDHNNHRYFYSQGNFRPTVFAMPAGAAAAYFQQQQQQRFPNGFMYAHPPPHYHVHPPPIIHPHLLPQYYPMMSAQGILVEIMDDAEPDAFIPNGPMNGGASDPGLFMVTISGQRYIMNEAQVMQLVGEVYQQQGYQGNQQQQFQQQQQQQQQFRQHQQHMRQQQQQRGYPQQYQF